MNKQEQVQQMTTYMANFVSHIAKVLPDDIIAKLDELGAQEDAPLSKVIYETMKRNQKLAKELNHAAGCVVDGYITWADIRQMLKEYDVEVVLE